MQIRGPTAEVPLPQEKRILLPLRFSRKNNNQHIAIRQKTMDRAWAFTHHPREVAVVEQEEQNCLKKQAKRLHHWDWRAYVLVQWGKDSPGLAQIELQKDYASVWLFRLICTRYHFYDLGKYIDKGNYAQVYECVRKDNG